MKQFFVAKNDKQLGICLRMLFAENLQYRVRVVMNDKNKVGFQIQAFVTKDEFEKLNRRYEILIS